MTKQNFTDKIFAPKPLSELKIDSDFIFTLVMQKTEICKRLCEILLGAKIQKIVYNETQKSKKKFYLAKSVRFDAYLVDSDKVINVEMQSSHYENLMLRARYYQSMIDSTLLKKGEPYKNLKDTFLLFICREDPFRHSLPIYTLKTRCDEDKNLAEGDGATKKFFNCSAYKNVQDDDLRAFLEYVYTCKATSEFTKTLDKIIEEEKILEENIMNYNDLNMVEMDAREQGYAMAVAEKSAEISERDDKILRMNADNARMSARIAELEAQLEARKQSSE